MTTIEQVNARTPETSTATISCRHCGEALNIVSLADDDWDDHDRMIDEFRCAHADCDKPVEQRTWNEFNFKDRVFHHGDLTRLSDVPRPSWALRSNEHVGSSLVTSSYRSDSARIPLSTHIGKVTDEECVPASVNVCAKLGGTGVPGVLMTVWRLMDGKWSGGAATLTIDEALQLAQVLVAATDLAVTK